MQDSETRIISEKDVIASINYAIQWNQGDESTTELLIHVGADILGVDEETFGDMLGYQDYWQGGDMPCRSTP